MTNLKLFQNYLKESNIGCWLVPINDEHFSEYVPEYNQRLRWLTGFTGSYATLLVKQDICHFFTDGRYVLQAKEQLKEDQYNIYDIKAINPHQISENLKEGVWYDPELSTESYINKFKCKLHQLHYNPLDLLWVNREKPKIVEIFSHPEEYSGMSSLEKCKISAIDIPFFLTDGDSICWLLNIRGIEVKYTPTLLCYAILYPNFKVELLINDYHKLNIKLDSHISVLSISCLNEKLATIPNIALDVNNTSIGKINSIKGNITKKTNICELPKACKNDVEISGAISGHMKDGLVYVEFLYWLFNNSGVTEIQASEKLLSLRKTQELFISNSFETISAFAENGAIIHYHPTEGSNKTIEGDNLYLVDSGAQYLNSTTDITRTILVGKATEEHKLHYTLVLKALIAVSRAIFIKNTTGGQLDVLARAHLWQNFYDYPHGTGHGVGSFLSVHEGPQSLGSNVTLLPGMIISVEPGYYIEGNYGIRLENLVYVKDLHNGFYTFETLTMVPFDIRLINFQALNHEELLWLRNYHKRIFDTLSTHLEGYLKYYYVENYIL